VALAVVIGDVFGSAIFRVPSVIAGEAGSVTGIAVVWILGGIITLCGALSLGELAAAIPRAGGVFVYLERAYGPAVGFLYGWTILLAEPAGAAAIALVFAEYLGRMVPLTAAGVRLVAALAIVAIAAAGYRSVRGAGIIATASTVCKVAALLVLVAAAFLLGNRASGAFADGASSGGTGTSAGGIGLGLVTVLWAYTGWHDLSLVAGEVRDPGRILPRALGLGIGIVVMVYLAANAAFLYLLPLDQLRHSPLVASDAMTRVLGPAGADVVALLVMISVLGALNGSTLVNPRVFYGMALEGMFFQPLARVHPRFRTPHVAISTFALLALVFVWTRSFDQLIESFVLGVWPFLALSVLAVLVLRRREPELVRPYRVPGYPWVPLCFVLGTVAVVVSSLVQHPLTTLAGIALTLAGLPLYLLFKHRRSATTSPSPPTNNPRPS